MGPLDFHDKTRMAGKMRTFSQSKIHLALDIQSYRTGGSVFDSHVLEVPKKIPKLSFGVAGYIFWASKTCHSPGTREGSNVVGQELLY